MDTFEDIIDNCVGPSLDSLHDQLVISFFVSFIFNLVVRTGKLSENIFHCFSISCGLVVLYVGLLGSDIGIHLSLIVSGYILLYYCFKLRDLDIECLNSTYLIQCVCVIFLIWGEFYYPNVDMWLRCRGIAMITVMKLVSLAVDFNNAPRPNFAQYAGYMLCPANCMLGPWNKYSEYVRVNTFYSPLNFKWFLRILQTTGLAFIFLSISNCFAEHYIPEDNEWIAAYKKALCFRTSHYFVSYLAEAVMLTAGYNEKVGSVSKDWSYVITNPFYVELPRSLTTVVIYWNIPMHRFLKMYIYILYLPYSNAIAIFLTYLFSALLHGMNIQIGLVLLSLGGFSYIQAISQLLASRVFNACVKVRPCIYCEHRFKRYHPLTLLINLFFMLFNVAHLTYLGGVMNIISTNRSILDTLIKWESLGYSSHHIFFMVFCILWLFKGAVIDSDDTAPPAESEGRDC